VKLLAKSRETVASRDRRGNGAEHRSAVARDGAQIAEPTSRPAPPGGEGQSPSGDIAADLAPFFRLLADETRLRIVQSLIEQKEIHVRALCQRLGQSQPAVSHHLALLREAGLIDVRRDGKHNFYHLLPAGFCRFLDRLFWSAGPHERRIRFEQYVLSYSPPTVD
jgi:ArsR family transcriptional regulator